MRNKMQTANEVLDAINNFIADRDVQTREKDRLWDVLSALRGPDFMDDEAPLWYGIKLETTAKIRSCAFPALSNNLWGLTVCVGKVNLNVLQDVWAYKHFNQHVKNAVLALRKMEREI